MKHKVIAIALSAALALSSTSAFAAEVNTTKGNFDYSSLVKNLNNCPNKDNTNILSKITINGKSIDFKSIDWKSIIKTNTTKPATTTPVVTQPVVTKPVTATPVVTKPVATAPVVTKPVATQPVVTQPVKNEPINDSTEKDSTSNTSVSSSNLTYEQKVVELVNIERQKNGLSALTLDAKVSNVARTKSKDMATNNYFAHQSPTYGSAGDMLKQFGIQWSAWGENIASGQRTPEAVVTAWMNSSGHRANILSSNFSKIGVGYVTNSNGTPYWTQIFTN